MPSTLTLKISSISGSSATYNFDASTLVKVVNPPNLWLSGDLAVQVRKIFIFSLILLLSFVSFSLLVFFLDSSFDFSFHPPPSVPNYAREFHKCALFQHSRKLLNKYPKIFIIFPFFFLSLLLLSFCAGACGKVGAKGNARGIRRDTLQGQQLVR